MFRFKKYFRLVQVMELNQSGSVCSGNRPTSNLDPSVTLVDTSCSDSDTPNCDTVLSTANKPRRDLPTDKHDPYRSLSADTDDLCASLSAETRALLVPHSLTNPAPYSGQFSSHNKIPVSTFQRRKPSRETKRLAPTVISDSSSDDQLDIDKCKAKPASSSNIVTVAKTANGLSVQDGGPKNAVKNSSGSVCDNEIDEVDSEPDGESSNDDDDDDEEDMDYQSTEENDERTSSKKSAAATDNIPNITDDADTSVPEADKSNSDLGWLMFICIFVLLPCLMLPLCAN